MVYIKDPPKWFGPASVKIFKVVVKQTPNLEAACEMLTSLLLEFHAHVYADDDLQAAALALADTFTELAAELESERLL